MWIRHMDSHLYVYIYICIGFFNGLNLGYIYIYMVEIQTTDPINVGPTLWRSVRPRSWTNHLYEAFFAGCFLAHPSTLGGTETAVSGWKKKVGLVCFFRSLEIWKILEV